MASQTGATHYQAQLVLLNKGRAIKSIRLDMILYPIVIILIHILTHYIILFISPEIIAPDDKNDGVLINPRIKR